MQNPSVSVIVPVYNCGTYLHKCLESLVNQTYDNYKVIVVNDCSTDNSMTIINEFIDKYPETFSCLTTNGNIGAGGARNFGIQHAEGKYLMFVDGDDFVSPSFIELPVKVLEETNSDIAQFNYRRYRSNTHNTINQDVTHIGGGVKA